jgi:hypothetical protein
MIVPIVWSILGVCLLGIYNALLILDDRTPEEDPKNKEIEGDWHEVGACLFIYLGITAWYSWGIEYAPLIISLFWCLFAGIVHTIGLKKPFFFVGTTAKTDQLIRKIFKKKPEVGSGILKIVCILLSLVLIFA